MNCALVIDTSFIMSDLLPDENGNEINLALYDIHVPALFYLECNNVLQVALKRNRIEIADHKEYLQVLNSLPIIVDKFSATCESLYSISKLSQKHDITAYDAAYLELAIRLGAKLASGDRKLIKAALENKIEIL